MNACTWASCGMCGMCDDGVREHPEPRQYYLCDCCGQDAIYPVTLAGVGIACSRACMDVLERQYAHALMARVRHG